MLTALRRMVGLMSLAGTAAAVTPNDVSFSNAQAVVLTGKVWQGTGSNLPAVVMMHGCSGAYSSGKLMSVFQEWGDRLVQAGYTALLVDSFTPRGISEVCGQQTGIEVNDRPYDALAAYEFLIDSGRSGVSVDRNRVGLLGWSNGGSATLASLSDSTVATYGKRYRAAVAFYPGCGLYNQFGGISKSTYQPYAPLQILHGGADSLYLDGYCATRVERAKTLGASNSGGNAMTLTVYAGAQHSFDLARSGDAQWTSADLAAKPQADLAALSHLQRHVANALQALVEPAAADLGKSGNIYLAAQVGSLWYAHNGSQWQVWNGGILPAYRSGPLTATTLAISDNLAALDEVSLTVYVGYGLSLEDMLSKSSYRAVYGR